MAKKGNYVNKNGNYVDEEGSEQLWKGKLFEIWKDIKGNYIVYNSKTWDEKCKCDTFAEAKDKWDSLMGIKTVKTLPPVEFNKQFKKNDRPVVGKWLRIGQQDREGNTLTARHGIRTSSKMIYNNKGKITGSIDKVRSGIEVYKTPAGEFIIKDIKNNQGSLKAKYICTCFDWEKCQKVVEDLMRKEIAVN